MKISKEWLDQFIQLDVSKQELSETITRGGIEVDDIIDYREGIKDVVVGYVKSCEKHPDADRLNVCIVDVGDKDVQIVCGAPNVQANSYVIVAKSGGRLPGLKLKKTKLRGVESNGMICSLEELGIQKDLIPKEFEDGIFMFKGDVTPGQNALQALFLDDYVLEYDLTPNRKDALSYIGSAYEVRALFGGEVAEPEQTVNEQGTIQGLTIKNENSDAIRYYSARLVENVKIEPSPEWMQIRLIKSGIRPINNVVDISNYVLLEFGQPIHMFDYDHIGSQEIINRYAYDHETMTTLDGKERVLNSNDLVVTNGKEPIALAGVMGGQFSEVSEETTTVVIESALFNPTSVRKTSSRLGLRSEASIRIEKGISDEFAIKALNRAAHLLEKYASGTTKEGIVYDGKLDLEDKTITTSLTFLNNRLGLKLSSNEVKEILRKLGIKAEGEETITCYIPSRRDDLKIQEDISEEVARIYGYDNIPSTLPKYTKITPGQLTDAQLKERNIRNLLLDNGFSQAINYALTSKENIQKFTDINNSLSLDMPMSEKHAVLRTSLIPHLVENATYNINRQQSHVELFEVGNVFESNGQKELPNEITKLAAIATGTVNETKWLHDGHEPDFYHLKGIVEAVLNQLNLIDEVRFIPTNKYDELHPGRSAEIFLHNQRIGIVGELHPTYRKLQDLKQTTVMELNLDRLFNESKNIEYQLLSKYPSISRDIALEVDSDVTSDKIINIIHEVNPKYLVDVYPFDVYAGENIETDKKSIALHLTYQNTQDTLKDSEVEQSHQPVIDRLEAEGYIVRV